MREPAGTATAPDRTVTADELYRMPDDGYDYALGLAGGDTLDGAPVLPGFRPPVVEIFA